MPSNNVLEESASLNRATLVFADPFVLALFYAALTERHTVVQVVNTHGDQAADEIDTAPCNDLTVTIDLDGSGWMVEVALELREIDAIKRQMEVKRQMTPPPPSALSLFSSSSNRLPLLYSFTVTGAIAAPFGDASNSVLHLSSPGSTRSLLRSHVRSRRVQT